VETHKDSSLAPPIKSQLVSETKQVLEPKEDV
jgi:hypothetical protein